MITDPAILECRLNKSTSVNQFYLVKLVALKQLATCIGMYDNNPYAKGDRPYESDIIKVLIMRIYIEGMPSYFYQANALLLDYYFPEWRTIVSTKALSLTATRNSPEYRRWKASVLLRDSHTCQDCGSKENIHAHHIADWATNIELRVVVDNGITLCGECHHNYHHWMGEGMFKPKNTIN